jgi:hypothetical protein
MSNQEQLKAQLPEDFDKIRHLYYKKIIHPENERLKNHIFIRSNSIVRKVVAFSIDLILNKKFPNVILSAISKNMDKVVFIAELIKRKLKGLSQQTSLGTLEFQEVFLPKDHVKNRPDYLVKRKATILSIILDYRDTIDTAHYGYQRPLPLNQVSTKNPRDYVLMIINEYKNKRKGRWPGEKVYKRRGERMKSETPEKEPVHEMEKPERKKSHKETNDQGKKYSNKNKNKKKKGKRRKDYYDDDRDYDDYRDNRRNYDYDYDYDYDDNYYEDKDYYNSGKKSKKGGQGYKKNYKPKNKGKGNYYY